MYKVGVFPGKFFPPHRGHVNAIIHAATQCEKLYVVVSDNPDISRKKCLAVGIRDLPLHIRARWMAKELKGFDHIQVIILDETGIPEYPEGTVPWSKKLVETIPEKFDAIFGGEVEYGDTYMVNFPGVSYVLYDYDRSRYHMSGTKIRNNPLKYWDYILGCARPHFAKRVLITGVESCGKTTLTRYLAKIFHTSWTEEYGRYFIDEELGGCDKALTVEDFTHIAEKQKEWEEEALRNANRVVFFDSDAVLTQYYCKLYLGEQWLDTRFFVDADRYDLVLFMEPTVKWVPDGQRFVSDQRRREQLSNELCMMYRAHGFEGIIRCYHATYSKRLDYVMRMVDILLGDTPEPKMGETFQDKRVETFHDKAPKCMYGSNVQGSTDVLQCSHRENDCHIRFLGQDIVLCNPQTCPMDK